jgi:hypothetical protein
MTVAKKRIRRRVRKHRVLVDGQSVGVFDSKTEANAFKKRTKARYRESDMRKLNMHKLPVTVKALSKEEDDRYHPTFEELLRKK